MAVRELQEAARRPANRRLRFGSATVGIVLLWIIVLTARGPGAQTGGLLIASFHALLLLLILAVVPGLTADCIAREKREGTLGLLFLTPLSASRIVSGKLLAQGLRALTLWLAILPVLTIPFLLGGVTWFDALSALSFEFCATVLCLGAGLLASSLSKERNTAFLLAFLFAASFLLIFAQTYQLVLIAFYRGLNVVKDINTWRLQGESIAIFIGFGFRNGTLWSFFVTFSNLITKIWIWLCWCSPAIALLVLFAISWLAAARIKNSWQDKVPSQLRERFFNPSSDYTKRKTGKSRAGERSGPKFEMPSLVAPLFGRRFRRRMQRMLERNPIAWLQQYSWKARVSKWCLCLIFLAIVCASATGSEKSRDLTFVALLLTLAGFYTFAGVSGFLEEKRSGALEILLVTPVSASQLILGRTWGLWKRFLPASLVLASLFAVTGWQRYSIDGDWSPTMPASVTIILCGFLTLPIFATYFALRVKNLIAAAALTWVALCTPVLFALAGTDPFSYGYRPNRPEVLMMPIFVLFWNGVFATLTGFLLRHSLSRRLYSFGSVN